VVTASSCAVAFPDSRRAAPRRPGWLAGISNKNGQACRYSPEGCECWHVGVTVSSHAVLGWYRGLRRRARGDFSQRISSNSGTFSYGRVADFLRCPDASGKSTSFCASFTLSMSEPPPCRFSIFAMSAMSAYCTAASDARFFTRICGVLWYATPHPSLSPPWLEFAPLDIGTMRRYVNPLSRATRRFITWSSTKSVRFASGNARRNARR